VTVAAPTTDAAVVGFWRFLGLPGLIDVHVHFMPVNVMRKVWAYFDEAGPMTGREWPITYRGSEDQRLALLRAMGVRAFPSLVYPHKPGMAQWLNGWASTFADAHDDVIRTATMYPEPEAASYVEEAVRAGVRIFKVHVQVGKFDPRDPLLDAAWGILADAQIPVVVHAGSGPTPGEFTGPGPFAEVLARHPRLAAVVAHMGMPEYAEFMDLADRYENVRLDTTMAFTNFSSGGAELGHELAPRLAELQPKILLGTDFPNIPHPFAHQLEALVRLDLSEDWLRDVCWNNAAALFGIRP
jgi:predicted TIM-barrel fold metal-dependent hydrolase